MRLLKPKKEKIIEQILKAQKAEKIVKIPLKNLSSLADMMIVATGRSTRHLSGLADKVTEGLMETFGTKPKIEGEGTGWIVMDCSNVIVHLFTPDERSLYAIEDLWAKTFQTKE